MTEPTEIPADAAAADLPQGQFQEPTLSGPSQARSIAARILGAKGGRVKSPAKTRAARQNGKLGGRPKPPEKLPS